MDQAENNNDIMNPESVAWKLLCEDIDTDECRLLISCIDDNVDFIKTTFDTLLLIFIEMIFMLVKFQYIEDGTDNFVINLENFDIMDFFDTVKCKFENIGYSATLIIYDIDMFENDNDLAFRELSDNRYCRLELHEYDNNDNDSIFYKIKLNEGCLKKQYKKIDDMYTILMLNNKIYKISFYKI